MKIAITSEIAGYVFWTGLNRTEEDLINELEQNKNDDMSFIQYERNKEIKKQSVHSIFFCDDNNIITSAWDAHSGYRQRTIGLKLPEILVITVQMKQK